MKNDKSTKGKKISLGKGRITISVKVKAALDFVEGVSTIVKRFCAKYRIELVLLLGLVVLGSFAEFLSDPGLYRCTFICIIGVAGVGVAVLGVAPIVTVVVKGLYRLRQRLVRS